MLSIAPGVAIVDLTHEVPGFGVTAGAETLQHATRYMPSDAVYLAVVDPGVGTKRRGVALRAGEADLVGPDNGLLVPAADTLGGISEVVALTNPDFHVSPVSNTFHGRDVFAPAAAHLASGLDLSELGEVLDPSTLQRLDETEAEKTEGGGIVARIIAVDRYGNARLSVAQEDSGLKYGDHLTVDAGDGEMAVRYLDTFGAAKSGELIIVPDSHWRLSVAINKGSAARALALKVGTRVRLSFASEPAEAREDDRS